MHPKKLLLFTTSTEKVSVSVTFKEGTFWLSQKAIAELFGVKVPAISKHLKNIFETGELEESSTVSKMEIVHQEGKREVQREVDFYRLEAILAVGYRVNSTQATDFLDGFLELSNYPILTDKGKVSMLEAKLKAEQEYDKFRVIQDRAYESDFDKEVKKLNP